MTTPRKRKAAPPAAFDPIPRLAALFTSNERMHLEYDPKTGRAWSKLSPLTPELWAAHLEGRIGVGGGPIRDDHTCMWAGLDLDNHGMDEDLPIAKIWDDIQANRLPLITCRTKSGGVHCYVFFSEAQPAAKIRNVMAGWARRIGYPKCEIFPKQSSLREDTKGGRQLPNPMNFPYFGGDDTNRYCVDNTKRLSTQDFVLLAEKKRMTSASIKLAMIEGHEEAPPCLQRMMVEGVPGGQRNEALYNFVTYLKKAFPDSVTEEAKQINFSVFDKPIGSSEFTRTVNSASRPECRYRCHEEPMRSYCDRETCQTRKYGIGKDEYDALSAAADLPKFTDLIKYVSEPVLWEMKIDGRTVAAIPTSKLLDWRIMREIIAEKLTKVVPLVKPQEWERILQPLMAEARIVETPDDASIAGVIRERLREFASKTDLTNKGQNIDDRRAMLRGLPCVQEYQGERVVMFRQMDLIAFLKRSKSEELKGIHLWMAVKELGLDHAKLRVGGNANINVWYLPVREVLNDRGSPEAPDYKSEL